MSDTEHALRIGPAGWAYADWKGKVYPAPRPRGFNETTYLAEFFDAIEINTSFYAPPSAQSARDWVRRVERNRNFRFTAKLFRRFTHERNASVEDERAFKEGIAPLVEADRFGTLLLQFPWSFRNEPENREYLGFLVERFREYPLVLEVRHSSWNRPEIVEMLEEMNVGFCNIDQPLVGRSLPPSEHVTTRIGYVRLHGRNYGNWFSDRRAAERYDYLYPLHELEPWVARIKSILEVARVVYVIANNHFEGKAVANALELAALVRGIRVRVPKVLLANYPELRGLAVEEGAQPASTQIPLFSDGDYA